MTAVVSWAVATALALSSSYFFSSAVAVLVKDLVAVLTADVDVAAKNFRKGRFSTTA